MNKNDATLGNKLDNESRYAYACIRMNVYMVYTNRC